MTASKRVRAFLDKWQARRPALAVQKDIIWTLGSAGDVVSLTVGDLTELLNEHEQLRYGNAERDRLYAEIRDIRRELHAAYKSRATLADTLIRTLRTEQAKAGSDDAPQQREYDGRCCVVGCPVCDQDGVA